MLYNKLPTTEKLAMALEKLNDPALEPLIKRAREGYYDDYKTTIPTPLVQLAQDITVCGHSEFVERIKDGEFDATKEESDAWVKSPDGQAALRSLVKRSDR